MDFETMEIWDAMKQTKYNRTLEELRRVIRNAQGNLDEAISAVLNMTCSAVHAEAGTFWFYSRFGDGLIHPRAWNGGGDIGKQYLLPGEGIAGQVIETGEATMISNCQNDPRWAQKVDKDTGFVTQSMICVPLKAEGLTFGCIQLINKTDGNLFDEKDLAFELRLAEEISEQFVLTNLLTDGKVEQDVAVLFVDIRGFTDIARTLNPLVTAQLLNEYLVYVTSFIRDYGGTADKYIGDCAMAYWRRSQTCREPAYMACKAAMAMAEGANALKKRLKERFGLEVTFGVGIHCGEAFVGNIGTSVLTDHTVVGDTVNTAAMLEASAPAGKVLISGTVAQTLGKKAKTTPMHLGLSKKRKLRNVKCLILEKLQ